jgi:hypothetical protein
MAQEVRCRCAKPVPIDPGADARRCAICRQPILARYIVATSLYGPLEIHREGCQHAARLFAGGGGVLADLDTLAAARQFAENEVSRPPKLAPCLRRR